MKKVCWGHCLEKERLFWWRLLKAHRILPKAVHLEKEGRGAFMSRISFILYWEFSPRVLTPWRLSFACIKAKGWMSSLLWRQPWVRKLFAYAAWGMLTGQRGAEGKGPGSLSTHWTVCHRNQMPAKKMWQGEQKPFLYLLILNKVW